MLEWQEREVYAILSRLIEREDLPAEYRAIFETELSHAKTVDRLIPFDLYYEEIKVKAGSGTDSNTPTPWHILFLHLRAYIKDRKRTLTVAGRELKRRGCNKNTDGAWYCKGEWLGADAIEALETLERKNVALILLEWERSKADPKTH